MPAKKKDAIDKKKPLPVWAQLRIAYDYATSEEKKEFNKLSESILKREKINLKDKRNIRGSSCETDCKAPLREKPPCPTDCLGYNEKPPCTDCEVPLRVQHPPCTFECLTGKWHIDCEPGRYIPPCSGIHVPLGKNLKRNLKKP